MRRAFRSPNRRKPVACPDARGRAERNDATAPSEIIPTITAIAPRWSTFRTLSKPRGRFHEPSHGAGSRPHIPGHRCGRTATRCRRRLRERWRVRQRPRHGFRCEIDLQLSSASRSRSRITTCAPTRTRAGRGARPIPCAPPVMTMTSPVASNIAFMIRAAPDELDYNTIPDRTS